MEFNPENLNAVTVSYLPHEALGFFDFMQSPLNENRFFKFNDTSFGLELDLAFAFQSGLFVLTMRDHCFGKDQKKIINDAIINLPPKMTPVFSENLPENVSVSYSIFDTNCHELKNLPLSPQPYTGNLTSTGFDHLCHYSLYSLGKMSILVMMGGMK